MNEATIRRRLENQDRTPEEIEEDVGRWAEDFIDALKDYAVEDDK